MAMLSGRYCYSEVLPFAAMVFLQIAQVAQSTVFKAATEDGMSYRVFIVYAYALSGLVLLPFAFIFDRKKQLPPFDVWMVGRICLLGILGTSAQMCGFLGIEYSSPTLASAISNLTPAFTFALAIIFRMEKVDIRSLSSRAKIIGTVVSISGAFVVVLYEGPTIVSTTWPSTLNYQPLKSPQFYWIIGGLLLTVDYLFISTWYIVQVLTVKKYPAELLVVALYNLCVSVMAAPVSLIMEPNLSAWKISSKMMLISILYAGLFGSSFATVILTWGLSLKGPVYVALFTPLSIVIAAIMGVIFLGDSLYLGCVIGAIIISVGFYVVMWGKAKEEMAEDSGVRSLEAASAENVPLLQ